MPIIDPTTPLGKVRLRVGDWNDLPILPDSVIESALIDCQDNVQRASSLCAQYILATLTAKTHQKLAQIESWDSEQFDNYVKFLRMTVLNPNLTTVAPVPYVGAGSDSTDHPLIQFIKDWRDGYNQGSTVIAPQGPGRTIEPEAT